QCHTDCSCRALPQRNQLVDKLDDRSTGVFDCSLQYSAFSLVQHADLVDAAAKINSHPKYLLLHAHSFSTKADLLRCPSPLYWRSIGATPHWTSITAHLAKVHVRPWPFASRVTRGTLGETAEKKHFAQRSRRYKHHRSKRREKVQGHPPFRGPWAGEEA